MRLLIAGILSLVIYLLTCAYGNEGKAAPKVEKKQVYEPELICYPPYSFDFIYFFGLPDLPIVPPILNVDK